MTRFGVMKHLSVLEDAGLVLVRRDGRHRFNHLNAVPLRQIYERWVNRFADHWATSLVGMKRSAESAEQAPADPLTAIQPGAGLGRAGEFQHASPLIHKKEHIMTATSSLSPIELGMESMQRARGWLMGLLEDIPQDKLTHQPQPKANHIAWIMGHIANTDDFFRTTLGDNQQRSLPESYNELFGMNSEPKADASAYPSKEELIAAMQSARGNLQQWVTSLSEERLSQPLPDELQMFASCPASLMHTLAIHESIHAGQVIEVRRSLGLPRKMG